jgi:glycerate 2-kinase
MTDKEHKARIDWLISLFHTGVNVVMPGPSLASHLPPPNSKGQTCVIAVGKAAAEMAAVVTQVYGQDLTGLVVTRYHHGVEAERLAPGIKLIEAGHPVPDDQSQSAAKLALDLAHALGPNDRLIALISGGGSALLNLPPDGVSAADMQQLTRDLLSSGAPIAEMNCVRKHLSRLNGGRLSVAAAPAKVFSYIISDVPGDDVSQVASGPTVADMTSLAEAREILARYGIKPAPSIEAALFDPDNETPSKDSPGLASATTYLIAKANDALHAASQKAKNEGYEVMNLGDRLEGLAVVLGADHAALALTLAQSNLNKPRLILSGGETTVEVKSTGGAGGRNLTYLLSLAIGLKGAEGIYALACDTDGLDGTGHNAGAVITPDTLLRGKALGLDAQAYLDRNDTLAFFAALGDLVVTGPTRTNVNDFRAILIEAT